VLTSCGSTSSIRHSLEYDKILTKSKKILILPASVNVYSEGIAKKTQQYNYEIYLSDIIAERIKLSLDKKGLKSTILAKKDIIDKSMYKDISKLRNKYNEAREELYKELLWNTEKAFSVSHYIDSSTMIIGDKTETDILLFVDYIRNIKTNGSRTLSFIADMMIGTKMSDDVDSAVMFIGLVNAKDGKLLWSNFIKITDSLVGSMFNNTGNDKTIDTNHIDKIVYGVLHEIKIGD
jgi:hypothetical protein